MIEIISSGDFNKTEAYLKKLQSQNFFRNLDGLAREGVAALRGATPVDTSLAADSWDYEIKVSRGSCVIQWLNHDVENGFPVAIMIQYGHGTGTGGYVSGIDYINPAIRPTFDNIVDRVWKAVTSQ